MINEDPRLMPLTDLQARIEWLKKLERGAVAPVSPDLIRYITSCEAEVARRKATTLPQQK